MNLIKRIMAVTAAAAILSAGAITAMAANYSSPAEIAASLTGTATEDIINESRSTGKSYGTIASEAGKLNEYKNACLSLKQATLDKNVADGLLTQSEADELYEAMQSHQSVCDGTWHNGNHGYGVCYGDGTDSSGGSGYCGGNGSHRSRHGSGLHHGYR